MKRFWLVLTVLVAAGATASAQDDGAGASGSSIQDVTIIDAETAVQLALANNLGVEVQDIDVRKAKRLVDNAWTVFIPQVSATGSLSRVNEVQDISGLAPEPTSAVGGGVFDRVVAFEEEGNRWRVGAELSAGLSVNLQIIRNIQQTVQQYDIGVINLQDAKAQLRRDVRKQFYELLSQQENIRITRESIETAEERFEQTQINYDNGLVDEFTLLSSRVQLENLRPQLEQQQLGYRSSLMGFKQTLGIDPAEPVELEGRIEADLISLEADAIIRDYLERRYDIQLARQSIIAQEISLDAKRAERYPRLSLNWRADPSFAGDPFDDPWFDDVENDWNQQGGAFSISITQPLDPLLPFSRTQVEIENLKDDVQKARIQLQQARTGAEIQIRQLVDQLETSRSAIDVRRLNVERARRAFNLAQEAYDAGNRELLEVREAEDELEQAQVQLLDEQKNYVVALLDLVYALNTSIDELRERSNEDGN
jgi:outer membrane protein TolC